MRVLVAGASGAIGQPLIRQLRDAGHEVLGTTRSPERAGQFEAAGATPVIVDALQTEALHRAVADAQPEVVINQLTALPDRLNYRNGYRGRSLDTRLGPLSLRIPKLRQGSYFPPFLEPRKTPRKRWSW